MSVSNSRISVLLSFKFSIHSTEFFLHVNFIFVDNLFVNITFMNGHGYFYSGDTLFFLFKSIYYHIYILYVINGFKLSKLV